MEFIDLKQQYQQFIGPMQQAIADVISKGQYIMGTQVQELEDILAKFVGANHCVGVCDGTKALLLALMALGVKPGDEVIMPSFTFISPASMTALLGAIPVFVDIDPNTYNLDPKLIESAITEKTKAIIAVSLYGQCADFNKINQIADKYQIPVVEDAAQSFGARQNGLTSCGMTTISTTSFFPSKPLGCYGDGGAIFTNDDELAHKIKCMRVHGQDKRYHHAMLGINGRLDTLQAAILMVKFTVFAKEVELRQTVANYYCQQIQLMNAQANGDKKLTIPYLQDNNLHVYGQYSLLATDNKHREDVLLKLKSVNIPTAIHYPIPLHKQPIFIAGGSNPARMVGDLDISEDIASRVFSIPMHPYLTQEQQDRVVEAMYL